MPAKIFNSKVILNSIFLYFYDLNKSKAVNGRNFSLYVRFPCRNPPICIYLEQDNMKFSTKNTVTKSYNYFSSSTKIWRLQNYGGYQIREVKNLWRFKLQIAEVDIFIKAVEGSLVT